MKSQGEEKTIKRGVLDLPRDIWSPFQLLVSLTTAFRPFGSLRADIQNKSIIMALKRGLIEILK